MAADEILDVGNVGVAKGRFGGYAAWAPVGTSLDKLADMTKTIADLVGDTTIKAVSLGYISEDGVEFSTDTSVDDKPDWGGTVVSSNMTSYSESAKVTFLESRDSVLKAVYGQGNVSTDEKKHVTTVRHNAKFTDPGIYIFDAVIGDSLVLRSIIPLGRIFERDSRTQNNSDLLGYTPTIKCMPCAAMDGDTYRDYLYDASAGTVTQMASHEEALKAAEAK